MLIRSLFELQQTAAYYGFYVEYSFGTYRLCRVSDNSVMYSCKSMLVFNAYCTALFDMIDGKQT